MKRRPAGFTLLEVLVALAVLAIAMGAIIGVATQSINSVGYLRDQTFAGWAALNSMFVTTWEMDHTLGTQYHPRLLAWLKDAQSRDITIAGALTDAKGDRTKGPSQQADKDVYLHMVQKRPDGIVR